MGQPLAWGALLALTAGGAMAQGYSLLGDTLGAERAPLVATAQPGQAWPAAQPLYRARAEIPDTVEAEAARGRAQSLFIDRASGGLFAPLASPGATRRGAIADAIGPAFGSDPQAGMVRDLIAYAEAGPDGYNAVQYGARRRPDRPPTQMTLGDIFAWIEATPGQPHAIGRYQFIPSTLARLVTLLDAGSEERFSPQMQDRLADLLLAEAGLGALGTGEITRHEFMDRLAQIWAGLPTSSGRSHYDGVAGNVATISWSEFDTEMARIFEG